MKIQPLLFALLFAFLLAPAVAVTTQAWGNGVGFFDDEEEGMGPHGTPYFGFVKSEQGKAVAGVAVTIRVKGQTGEYKSETTVLGLYRSTDIPRDADPKAVEVTIAKAGFQEVRKTNRNPLAKPGMPVQVDFVVKPADQKALAK